MRGATIQPPLVAIRLPTRLGFDFADIDGSDDADPLRSDSAACQQHPLLHQTDSATPRVHTIGLVVKRERLSSMASLLASASGVAQCRRCAAVLLQRNGGPYTLLAPMGGQKLASDRGTRGGRLYSSASGGAGGGDDQGKMEAEQEEFTDPQAQEEYDRIMQVIQDRKCVIFLLLLHPAFSTVSQCCLLVSILVCLFAFSPAGPHRGKGPLSVCTGAFVQDSCNQRYLPV